MVILALDASTHSTGAAVFQNDHLLHHQCITASSNNLIDRIEKVVAGIKQLLEHFPAISKIILQEVRPQNGLQNLQTQKALMWLQAAIAIMVHDNFKGKIIEFLYPSEWRKCCGIKTGRGVRRQILKKQDIQFVKEKFNIDVSDDQADACGIGYAYFCKYNNVAW